MVQQNINIQSVEMIYTRHIQTNRTKGHRTISKLCTRGSAKIISFSRGSAKYKYPICRVYIIYTRHIQTKSVIFVQQNNLNVRNRDLSE